MIIMMSNFEEKHQKHRKTKEKIQCDVFFSIKDITALRWVSEINKLLKCYQDYVVINVHQINSDYARKMEIFSDTVVINNEKLEFYEINRKLFEIATNFINDLPEFNELAVVE